MISDEEARRIFIRERNKFAEYFPGVSSADLILIDRKCSIDGHCRFRDLAYADQDDMVVGLLTRALKLSRENVIGLIRHELGHLSDERINYAWREQRADDIAEFVTGRTINYDERNIQTIGPGRYPRPRNLHR